MGNSIRNFACYSAVVNVFALQGSRGLALLFLAFIAIFSSHSLANSFTLQGVAYRSNGGNIALLDTVADISFYHSAHCPTGCDLSTNVPLSLRNGAFAVSLTASSPTKALMSSDTTGWFIRVEGVLSDESGALSGIYDLPLRFVPFATVSSTLSDSADAGDSAIAAINNSSSGTIDASKIGAISASSLTAGTLPSGTTIAGSGVQGSINGSQISSGTLSPSALSTHLTVSNGGTGLNSVAQGDILYSSATNTLSTLNAGSNGQVLTITAGVPSWETPSDNSAAIATNASNISNNATSLASKLNNSLASGTVFIGDGSNQPSSQSIGGDATLAQDGTLTISSGAIDSAKIENDTIVNEDISSSAAIAGTKISPNFGAQNVSTTGSVTGATVQSTGNMSYGSQIFPTSGSHANSGTSIDWSNGNVQSTSASCGAMTFTNMQDGSSYTLSVEGTVSGVCSFSQAGLTFRFSEDHDGANPTENGTLSVFTFIRIGNNVFVSWMTGF